jgi:hypothetical protein
LDGSHLRDSLQFNKTDTEISGNLAQLATVAFVAYQAGIRMTGKHQFDYGLPTLYYSSGGSVDYHAWRYGDHAGCQQGAVSFIFYYANAAGADCGQLGIVTEGRYIHA